ncbi:MAG: hypothetical protein QXG63_06555 [Nitrososphaerales archaeon]
MPNNDMSVEALAARLLQAADGLIDWREIPEEVRRKKYSIVAKRVAGIVRSAKSLDGFLERFLKEIAGDTLFISREKAKAFKDLIEEIKAEGRENDVLDYIR